MYRLPGRWRYVMLQLINLFAINWFYYVQTDVGRIECQLFAHFIMPVEYDHLTFATVTHEMASLK